jgi:hypothetical protein
MAWQIEFSDAADPISPNLTNRFNAVSSFIFMSALRAQQILVTLANHCSTS